MPIGKRLIFIFAAALILLIVLYCIYTVKKLQPQEEEKTIIPEIIDGEMNYEESP